MKIKKLKITKQNIGHILAWVIIGVFFCFLCFYYGVGEYPDSATYMVNNIDREPFYPLLLKGFRAVFGQEVYLKAVIVAQNVFAFLVTGYLYSYVTKYFALNGLFSAGALAVLLMPHLLTGVFASSGIILTNAILSEGVTLSLYQMFFLLLLRMFLGKERQGRYALFSWFTALVAVFTRGQMLVLLPIWMVVCIAGVCRKRGGAMRDRVIRISLIVIMTAAVFMIRSAGIRAYNSVVFGHAQGNTGGNMTLLTNVLYSTDAEDVELAARELDEAERTLLVKMDTEILEQHMSFADAGNGVQNKILHHEDCHDKIKFNILYEYLQDFMEQKMPDADAEMIKSEMDALAARYMKAVLPKCIGNWLKTYCYVVLGGFIRTVAVIHPVLNWYALLIYIVAAALMCYLFRRAESRDGAWLMAVVLLMTAANVCATALTIMCLSRYMIYNMALFYLAGLVCVWETVKGRGSKEG
ncbi:MAG: hypothetical protein K2K87_02725 [Lachnospiraceae bacterium]|nr:hypothetical protein [Lachnospiraceae bacterium]